MTTPNDSRSTDTTIPETSKRRRRSRWLAIALVAAVAIAAAGSAAAFFGRHHRWHDDEFDGERVRYGVEWMLHGVDPTDAQVDAITAIAVDAHEDLTSLKERHRETREAFIAAFTADEVDPKAIESLRTEIVSMADEGATRMAAAFTAAARELTAEQRRELVARHERRHRRHHDEPQEE